MARALIVLSQHYVPLRLDSISHIFLFWRVNTQLTFIFVGTDDDYDDDGGLAQHCHFIINIR